MFYCPKNVYDPYSRHREFPNYRVTPKTSYLRILHASPKSPAVDVYINDILKFKNLPYADFTDYIEVITGEYNVKIYAAGTTTSPVLSKNLFVPPEKIYTIAAIGLLPNIDLLPVPETKIMNPADMVYIKFAHLSPNTGPVDIVLPDGKILFKNISYKAFTDYIQVPAGTYTLEARPTGTKTTILYIPNIKLKSQRFYTVYAIGLLKGHPGLQALIPLDGSSYLEVRED
ncbi:DUF4397 domain-containing protein [Clostridium sp. CF012]|uniref:DUF4397 domain-containing protein n=1 Tax=Clostridium sp. CF012 TaxID=2843319 RepID=UPI001C0E5DD8|nr:DUF4397 domain-containing protein [Clostridium sp. CF012]MBU3143484.1 DUF4397 domain-containing protein [Clostridium sp. CF012]